MNIAECIFINLKVIFTRLTIDFFVNLWYNTQSNRGGYMENKCNDTMNLCEILRTELEKKGKDWSLLERALYIYFRTCQCFNYDETYYGGNMYTIGRRFDMTKIDDYKLVCSTWSYLYKDLADALLGGDEAYERTVILSEDEHNYINILTNNNETLLLDPVSTSDDFLVASRGFDFGVGPGKGIMYIEDGIINDEKAKMMLGKVIDGYSCNYLDYLKLVKEELKQKYHTDELSTLGSEELNEIFVYILATSNFRDLGIMEANRLIHKSLIELFGISGCSSKFSAEKCYGDVLRNSYYDLTVPKNDDENEVYRLTRDGSRNVGYKRVRTCKKDWDW